MVARESSQVRQQKEEEQAYTSFATINRWKPKISSSTLCADFSNFFDDQSLISMQPSVASNTKHPTSFCRLQATIIPVAKTTIPNCAHFILVELPPIGLRISQRLRNHDPPTLFYQKQVGMCSICYPNRIINRTGFTYELAVLINVKCPVPRSRLNTSRKHCKKEPQLFPDSSSFDHPRLKYLNDCDFFLFEFATEISKFLGRVIHRWKGF